MTDTTNQSNNDKIATLTKEAENLKLKLEEERQKLNDVSCKTEKLCQINNIVFDVFFFLFKMLIITFLQYHLWQSV